MRVGFIGLGLQGAPIAERIASAGYELTVWARREEVCHEWAARGVAVADSPAKLGTACDVVILCVTADADVTELMENSLLGSIRPGSVVIIHSTIGPDTCVRLGQLAAQADIEVLDAPVSGGPDAASAGTLLLMVGGNADTYQRALPIMKTYGDPVIYLGQLGNGLRAKIINNLVFIANMAAADHASRLGQALAIQPHDLQAVLQHGSARSVAATFLQRTFENHAAHVAELFRKDLGLAAHLAKEADISSAEFLRVGELLCARLVDAGTC